MVSFRYDTDFTAGVVLPINLDLCAIIIMIHVQVTCDKCSSDNAITGGKTQPKRKP
jgi:hypothetical protein